ncbi:RdgB/HAM1 family non-canonical purine NTP pyrophosphatase [archaeon]|nr:RdgB/HAM1 family non-canonical purine NTP pyrophosphatase [archaeon]
MLFVTRNRGKLLEAQQIIGNVKNSTITVPEIQSDSLTEIAAESAKYAYEELREPCFVEDSGLFVHDLKGFPGPYSHYAYDTIGLKGILKLMEDRANRGAEFRSVIGYANATEVKTFIGRVYGTITDAPHGDGGFGYDPIFIPLKSAKTFAEDLEQKNKLSHRAISMKALKTHLGYS